MIFRITFHIHTLFLFLFCSLGMATFCITDIQAQKLDSLYCTTRIDSIVLDRNWRTRDAIILRELLFEPGMEVSPDMMQQSLDRVWNVGNFATVDWTLDSLSVPGTHIFRLTARDAFTIIPLFAFEGSNQDFRLDVGVIDNNLLGRNITGRLAYRFATFERRYEVGLTIPRQLLPRNMTLGLNVRQGTGTLYRWQNRTRHQGVAFDQFETKVSLGSPWHEDYEYTVSPNLELTYLQHKTANSRLNADILPLALEDYHAQYLQMAVSENVGLINRKRHQEDRWAITTTYMLGLGLNTESPTYHSLTLNGAFHKLFNPVVQLSIEGQIGLTNASLPSLQFYRGASDVRSIRTGEIAGTSYYALKLGGFFTYINRDWFAMEHSVFLHFGQGSNSFNNLVTQKPLFALGTGLRFMTPMVPWFYLQVDVAHSGPNSNWYFIQW